MSIQKNSQNDVYRLLSHRIADMTDSALLLIGPNYRIQWMSRPAKKLLFEKEGTVVGKPCSQVLGGKICSAGCLDGEALIPVSEGIPFGPVCLEEFLGPFQIRNNILKASDGQTVGLLKKIASKRISANDPSIVGLEDTPDGVIEEITSWEATVAPTLSLVANTAIPILLVGETGTGKEVLAHRIHELSPRKMHPFVVLDLSVVPETLVDDALFGHARGAFTGAVSDYAGKLLQADKGTLFLDELENIPLSIQAKLLRFLETGIVEHIGQTQKKSVDVRILAATNVDPSELLRTGRLREDLFYRLRGMTIDLPPLRERPDDIPALIRTFRASWSQKYGREAPEFSSQVVDLLRSYRFPGNIRELRHFVDLCLSLSPDPVITEINLPDSIRKILFQEHSIKRPLVDDRLPEGPPGKIGETLSTVEKSMIQKVLFDNQGRVSEAAKSLSMSRITLWRKMKKYGLDRRRPFSPRDKG